VADALIAFVILWAFLQGVLWGCAAAGWLVRGLWRLLFFKEPRSSRPRCKRQRRRVWEQRRAES
jgi:hypothetical protein